MSQATQVVVSAGKHAGGLALKRVFFLSMTFVVFLVIILNATAKSIEQRSFTPFLEEVGARTVLATRELARESQKVIARGGFYAPVEGSPMGVLRAVASFLGIVSALFLCLTWIKVLAFLYRKSPFYGGGHWFTEFGLATIAFLIIQMGTIVVVAAHNNELQGWFSGPQSVTAYLAMPIYAFWLMVKAVMLLLPQSDQAVNLYEKVNNISLIPPNGSGQ